MYFSYRTLFSVFCPGICIFLIWLWNDKKDFLKTLLWLLVPELLIQLVVWILAWIITGEASGMNYDIEIKNWKEVLYFIISVLGLIYPVYYLVRNYLLYRKRTIKKIANKLFALDEEDIWSHPFLKNGKYYYGDKLANGFIDGREFKNGKVKK